MRVPVCALCSWRVCGIYCQDVGKYVVNHPVGKQALAESGGELERVVVVLKAKSPLVNLVLKGSKKRKGKSSKKANKQPDNQQ